MTINYPDKPFLELAMQLLSLGENVIVNLEHLVLVQHNPKEKKALLFLTNKQVEVFTAEDYEKFMGVLKAKNLLE